MHSLLYSVLRGHIDEKYMVLVRLSIREWFGGRENKVPRDGSVC